MAKRPVFVSISRPPFFRQYDVEFTYNQGLSTAQKQRNVEAIHQAFLGFSPGKNPLEISSKSKNPLGVSLSAFNLKKYIPSLDKEISVENAYQGGKKFLCGGPYTDLYELSPKEAKRDERLKFSGPMTAYVFEGVEYPTEPRNGFYDWLYVQALLENPELGEELQGFNSFTDIEFNPNKSINCQARAAAIFVGMTKAGVLGAARDFHEFCRMITGKSSVALPTEAAQPMKTVSAPTSAVTFSEGQVVRHPTFGEGRILSVNGGTLKILFPCGEKNLGAKWVSEKCK